MEMTRRGELLREDQGHIRKGFEFQGVSGWIVEEHRRLFAHFTLEADIGFDLKLLACGNQSVRQRLPLVHCQHHPEVWDRHGMPVNRIMVNLFGIRRLRLVMRDDLVPKQIEVNPLRRASPLRTPQLAPVKSSGSVQVVDGECNVKWRDGHIQMIRPKKSRSSLL